MKYRWTLIHYIITQNKKVLHKWENYTHRALEEVDWAPYWSINDTQSNTGCFILNTSYKQEGRKRPPRKMCHSVFLWSFLRIRLFTNKWFNLVCVCVCAILNTEGMQSYIRLNEKGFILVLDLNCGFTWIVLNLSSDCSNKVILTKCCWLSQNVRKGKYEATNVTKISEWFCNHLFMGHLIMSGHGHFNQKS